MAERTVFQEWRDSNVATNYPFSPTALLRNNQGDEIRQGTFVDASVFAYGAEAGLYLTEVEVAGATVTIRLGNRSNTKLISGSFDLTSPLPSSVRMVDAYGRPAGLLLASQEGVSLFAGWTQGIHSFTQAQTELCSRCVIPLPVDGVTGFLTEDGSLVAETTYFSGDAGARLTVRAEELPTGGPCGETKIYTVIRVDFTGEPLFKRAACEDAGLFQPPNFIRGIRFRTGRHEFICPPDQFGNISILIGQNEAENTILRLRAVDDSLVIEAAGS